MRQRQGDHARAEIDEEGGRGGELVDQLRCEESAGCTHGQQRTTAAGATRRAQRVHAQCCEEGGIDAGEPAVALDLGLADQHRGGHRESPA
jgi:hypothetical protein